MILIYNLPMTLNELKLGQSATITAVHGDGPLIQRLMAMGIIEGHEITVTRRALGGDPLQVDVVGYSLSLRKREALEVDVSIDPGQ